ncbi:MAG: heterodisulfide reductase subunit F [archaeon]|nr:heterodisulfide reductase subunit F [archaeon]
MKNEHEHQDTNNNPYIPKLVTITEIITENDVNDLKTFKLKFNSAIDKEKFFKDFVPGQFASLTYFGVGESPIGIASSPTEEDYLLFTIKKVGLVTAKLHDSKVGQVIGIRGPFGNGWPLDDLKGKNIVIAAGGFAFTTLRSLIIYIFKYRQDFGNLTVVYGAREPGELCYMEDLLEWEKMDKSIINLHLTVDTEFPNWTKHVGFVPTVTEQIAPSPENALIAVCGPPIMFKYTEIALKKLGFSDEQILVSLEMRMKCGIGKCGRCNVGKKFVCIDGPVFYQSELKKLLHD